MRRLRNAYYGMFFDSDGPQGVMKPIPERLTAYFRFMPMYYPFVLKKQPEVFVVQFGGGISTNLALRSGATAVTVAEANPDGAERAAGRCAHGATHRRYPARQAGVGDPL